MRKLELILFYFGIRKCSTHLVSLGFFCTLVPLTVFTPEVRWGWGWQGGGGWRLVLAVTGEHTRGSVPRPCQHLPVLCLYPGPSLAHRPSVPRFNVHSPTPPHS